MHVELQLKQNNTTPQIIQILWWFFPLLLSSFLWFVAYLYSCEEIWEVALQAIFLSQPPFMLIVWLFWSMFYSVVIHKRKIAWITFSIVLVLLFIQKYNSPPISSSSDDKHFDIAVFNVNAFSGQQEELELFLGTLDVDLLVMIEKRAEEIVGMQRIRDDFQEKRPKISHNNAVFCKEGLECSAWISDEIGSPNMSMPYLLIRLQQIQQQNICLIGIHAPPQVPIDASGMKPYIQELIPFMDNGKVKKDWNICKAGDSILLMGDLNAVPHSWAYEQIRSQGLIDPLFLSGLFGHTWPNGGGFIKFPLFAFSKCILCITIGASKRTTSCSYKNCRLT